jgi:putative effector of murein hydrolase LrgA (UPF0299 family)
MKLRNSVYVLLAALAMLFFPAGVNGKVLAQ